MVRTTRNPRGTPAGCCPAAPLAKRYRPSGRVFQASFVSFYQSKGSTRPSNKAKRLLANRCWCTLYYIILH